MKLLQVTHRLPYPLIDGGKKGIFGFSRGYSKLLGRDNFAIFCLAPQQEARYDVSELRALAAHCRIDYRNFDNTIAGLLKNTLFRPGLPYNMQKYMLPDALAELLKLIEQFQPDVLQFEHLHTAYYARAVRKQFPHIVLGLREHNVESTILARLAEQETNPVKKKLFRIQADRLHRYETEALPVFDLVLPITDVDAGRIESMSPGTRQLLVPAGADIPDTLPAGGNCAAPSIVHVAAMDWIPNQDGLNWFIQHVMPRLRNDGLGVTLNIAGKNMPERFNAVAASDIRVHGFLPDLQPLLDDACLDIVPLFVGGGMRVKILDYMAQGIPVVSTHVGAEGISDGHDGALLIADSAEDFAVQIRALLRQPGLRDTLRQTAYRLCTENYSWDAICSRVLDAYASQLAEKMSTP